MCETSKVFCQGFVSAVCGSSAEKLGIATWLARSPSLGCISAGMMLPRIGMARMPNQLLGNPRNQGCAAAADQTIAMPLHLQGCGNVLRAATTVTVWLRGAMPLQVVREARKRLRYELVANFVVGSHSNYLPQTGSQKNTRPLFSNGAHVVPISAFRGKRKDNVPVTPGSHWKIR